MVKFGWFKPLSSANAYYGHLTNTLRPIIYGQSVMLINLMAGNNYPSNKLFMCKKYLQSIHHVLGPSLVPRSNQHGLGAGNETTPALHAHIKDVGPG